MSLKDVISFSVNYTGLQRRGKGGHKSWATEVRQKILYDVIYFLDRPRIESNIYRLKIISIFYLSQGCITDC